MRSQSAENGSQPAVQAALRLLAESRHFADYHRRDVWEFAVELESLLSQGVRVSELRDMLCAGFIQSAREIAAAQSGRRRFVQLKGLSFPPNTCFVLSHQPATTAGHTKPADFQPGMVQAGPRWDRNLRILTFSGHVVKKFRVPARCQEIVLSIFQEQGWPVYIDDPLPPYGHIDSRLRLKNTIKALNRHQFHQLLHFQGNGTGKGVFWRTMSAAPRANRRTLPNQSRKTDGVIARKRL